jgi:hypothetical protein
MARRISGKDLKDQEYFDLFDVKTKGTVSP